MLTREEVCGIAEYARIALDEDELTRMCAYLNDALELIAPIRSFDLTGVEPTYHPIGDLVNVMADDVVDAHGRSLGLDAALGNAASVSGDYFRVPSILGGGGDL